MLPPSRGDPVVADELGRILVAISAKGTRCLATGEAIYPGELYVVLRPKRINEEIGLILSVEGVRQLQDVIDGRKSAEELTGKLGDEIYTKNWNHLNSAQGCLVCGNQSGDQIIALRTITSRYWIHTECESSFVTLLDKVFEKGGDLLPSIV